MAFHVSVPDVSVVDLTCRLKKYNEIKAVVKAASERKALDKYTGYTDEQVVSSYFIEYMFPSIFDAGAGIVLHDSFVKLVSIWIQPPYVRLDDPYVKEAVSQRS